MPCSSVDSRPVPPRRVRNPLPILAEIVPLRYPTVGEIMTAVVTYYGLTKIDMVSQRRSRRVVRPRQVAMYLSKQLTPLSLPNIGKLFGNRDHTTVMYACRHVEDLIASDPPTRDAVAALQQFFTRGED